MTNQLCDSCLHIGEGRNEFCRNKQLSLTRGLVTKKMDAGIKPAKRVKLEHENGVGVSLSTLLYLNKMECKKTATFNTTFNINQY